MRTAASAWLGALAACPLCSRRLPTPYLSATGLTTTLDADVNHVGDGLYYNQRLHAHNIWEIDVDPELIDEAASIFYTGSPFASMQQEGEPISSHPTRSGNFFALRVSWQSDIAWISADDEASFSALGSIFERLRLAERFAPFVPHSRKLRMYSAFFVSRSWCETHNWHTDYSKAVGTRALTLITPLRDYDESDSFQLSYHADGRGDDVRRYTYQKGRAVVFGSQFVHSTEPGAGADGEVHAYLCFTFGTDEQEAWPHIAETLDKQSRLIVHPDGELQLSEFGRELRKLEEICDENGHVPAEGADGGAGAGGDAAADADGSVARDTAAPRT